jgi:hypothetical protein
MKRVLLWVVVGLVVVVALVAARALIRRNLPFTEPIAQWSIAFYAGPTPLDLAPASATPVPAIAPRDLHDSRVCATADPFLVREDSTWYLFFEAIRGRCLNWREDKGVISLATSLDGRHWTYQQTVLEEPFHMSYPYVFKWDGQYYMIPETFQGKAIRLYRARRFPTQWEFVKNLVAGGFTDPSIFRYQDRWWMYAEASPKGKNDILRLYTATDLMGPWTEHPKSPIVQGNPDIARGGGRVLVVGDTILRFAQDDKPSYGNQVWAFRVTRLTPADYEEVQAHAKPVVAASGSGWNGLGMHTVDAHEIAPHHWFAAVDGIGWTRRWGLKYWR